MTVGGGVAAAFAPATAVVCVNGPAYPNERRFPLRPPAIAPGRSGALAWVVLVGAPVAAMLLLAGGRWVVGGIVAVRRVLAAAVGGRALHGLARRWLVVVPAGLVIHDPLSLADPVLFQRAAIAGLGPAPAQAERSRRPDVGRFGLALELRLTEPTGLLVIDRPGRRPTAETVTTERDPHRPHPRRGRPRRSDRPRLPGQLKRAPENEAQDEADEEHECDGHHRLTGRCVAARHLAGAHVATAAPSTLVSARS